MGNTNYFIFNVMGLRLVKNSLIDLFDNQASCLIQTQTRSIHNIEGFLIGKQLVRGVGWVNFANMSNAFVPKIYWNLWDARRQDTRAPLAHKALHKSWFPRTHTADNKQKLPSRILFIFWRPHGSQKINYMLNLFWKFFNTEKIWNPILHEIFFGQEKFRS